MKRVTVSREPNRSALPSGVWLDTLLEFVKWSQGQLPLEAALDVLRKYLGADAICLARRERSKVGVRAVQIVDRNSDPRKPRLTQSFALEMMGAHLDSLKPGATLLLSDDVLDRFERDPALDVWMLKRGITEIGAICIGSKDGIRDIVEFHFTGQAPAFWQVEADRIGRTLADVFLGRRAGLIDQLLLKNSRNLPRNRNTVTTGVILSPDNPAGLTRSEWRVCMLIAHGLSRDAIAKELGVTNNTLRSHLRNIYTKTGHETFHDLARRLVTFGEQRNLKTHQMGQVA